MSNSFLQPVTFDTVSELSQPHEPPCISLYQPTHRVHPQNEQDPIRFKKLIKKLTVLLNDSSIDEPTCQKILSQFNSLENDSRLWNYTLDSLCIFSSPDMFKVFTIPDSVEEHLSISDNFFTKPLRLFLQSMDRYQILALNRDHFQMFEGNRHSLEKLSIPKHIPQTMTEALGSEVTEPHLTVASYAGVGRGKSPAHHGHGGKSPALEIDTEKFFRLVDHSVAENFSKPSGLPLILAALPEHQGLFREITRNSQLIDAGISINSESIDNKKLRTLAWKALEPFYLSRFDRLIKDFKLAKSKSLASDDISEVANAIAQGRVDVLLLEAGRKIPGRVTANTGRIQLGISSAPDSDDVLDNLGELTTCQGGAVYIIPTDKMPTDSGVAATFRF